ncbi:MAG: acetate--CoA ligase family protein [bacterium]
MNSSKETKPDARAVEIIREAAGPGLRNLSENSSARLIEAYGVAVAESRLCAGAEEAAECAGAMGYPVALKLCSPDAPHKKEMGFVKIGLGSADAVLEAAKEMLSRAEGVTVEGLLVQRQVRGERELIAGMRRDRTFGPCVTLGVGGVFTEAMKDISVRVAPICAEDAGEMLDELKTAKMFGSYRGLPAVDREALAKILIGLGEIGLNHPEIEEIDVNPLIIDGTGKPIAVDALVVLGAGGKA